jgi:phage antirepressor YoqD-like protein
MNSLSTEKTMIIKEVAKALNVNEITIRRIIQEIYPDKLQHGKITYLNEIEVTAIKLTLQNSDKYVGVETDLEMLLWSKKVDAWKDKKIEILLVDNERMKPKEIAFDTFLSAENSLPVGDVGKLFGIGRTKFFQMLRDAEILDSHNVPFKDYLHHFEVIIKPIVINNKIKNIPVTMIRSSGIDYIQKRFKLARAS